MSQRPRLGLTDLKNIRRDLLKAVPEAVPPEVPQDGTSSAAAPAMVPMEGPTEVPPEVPQTVPRVLLDRKERKRLVSQSFKLPAELDERWTRIAAFNRITKTAILLEALETLLDRLPQAPTGAPETYR